MPVGSSLLGDLLIVCAVTGGRSPRVTKKKKDKFHFASPRSARVQREPGNPARQTGAQAAVPAVLVVDGSIFSPLLTFSSSSPSFSATE